MYFKLPKAFYIQFKMNHWNIFLLLSKENSQAWNDHSTLEKYTSEKLNKKYIEILASLRNDRLIQVICQFFFQVMK